MAAALVRVLPVANRGTGRFFGTAVVLSRRAAPLGPMPNENIDVSNLENLEKYRSYARYFKAAEQENKKNHWWKTCKQYLTQAQDEEAKVNIGLPYYMLPRWKKREEHKQIMKQNQQNMELERAARLRTLLIPLDEVKADWERTSGPYHVQRVAEYYGIYRDLFNEAFFIPHVILRVAYSQNEECVMPVYHGNVVTASEASSPPHVIYEAEEGSLWTLLLTNPDGHLRETEGEYVHWLIGNIPGNQVTSGEEVCHYFPPFPAKGTGYHRFIFILFKQDRPIDFGADLRPVPCHSLKMRTFKTLDFYKKHEDNMTPAGLAFFQCRWEDCVTQVFHHLLDMKEPVFEFDRPPVYHPPQKKYPHRQPLRYLDRYRDSNEPTYGIY